MYVEIWRLLAIWTHVFLLCLSDFRVRIRDTDPSVNLFHVMAWSISFENQIGEISSNGEIEQLHCTIVTAKYYRKLHSCCWGVTLEKVRLLSFTILQITIFYSREKLNDQFANEMSVDANK